MTEPVEHTEQTTASYFAATSSLEHLQVQYGDQQTWDYDLHLLSSHLFNIFRQAIPSWEWVCRRDETRTSLTLDPRATKKLAAHHTLAARRWQNANLSITYSNYYDVIDGLALAAPKPTITVVGCVKCYKQQHFSCLVADVLREQMK